MLLLGNLDVNVSRILDFMPQVPDGRIQARSAHRRRAHVHSAPLLPEVEGDAQNSYFHAVTALVRGRKLPTPIILRPAPASHAQRRRRRRQPPLAAGIRRERGWI